MKQNYVVLLDTFQRECPHNKMKFKTISQSYRHFHYCSVYKNMSLVIHLNFCYLYNTNDSHFADLKLSSFEKNASFSEK